MTRLDKQLASIDLAVIKQLSEPLPGQVHMRDIAQAQGWLTPDQFEVPPDLHRKLIERFSLINDHHWQGAQAIPEKAYPKWDAAQETFALSLATAYFQTFQARKTLSTAIERARVGMDNAPRAEYDRLQMLPEAAQSFYRFMTSTISHRAQAHLEAGGVGGNAYTPEQANQFLGVIIRGALEAYHNIGRHYVEVHPTAIGRTMFERVRDVKAAPVTDHAKAQELLAKLNALHPDPPARGR